MRIDIPYGMSTDVAIAYVKNEMYDRGYPASSCKPSLVEEECIRNSLGEITQLMIAYDAMESDLDAEILSPKLPE
jgi:hypothetical protein